MTGDASTDRVSLHGTTRVEVKLRGQGFVGLSESTKGALARRSLLPKLGALA